MLARAIRLRRPVRVVALTGLTAVGGYSAYEATVNDGQRSSTAMVGVESAARCARIVSTGAAIVLDYKLTFAKQQRLAREDGDVNAGNIESEYSHQFLEETHRRSAERLLAMCRANGGVYIKLGQHVSALTYLVPKQYCEVLSQLQDACPVTPLSEVRAMIERETGQPFDRLFSEFDPEPVGSASLAQVHRARLADGTPVAVKVQHPLVGQFSVLDIEMTDWVVHAVKRVFPKFEFVWLADEMRLNLPRELDFESESANASRLMSLFIDDPVLEVPRTRLVTHRVHVMDFVDGRRVDDHEYFSRHNIRPRRVAQQLSRIFGHMIFVHGFVHVDPHPGNMLIRHDPRSKYGFKICLLDHGLYRGYDDGFRLDYAHLWIAMLSGDEEKIKYYSRKLGGGDAYIVFSCILTARSWESIQSARLNTARSSSETAHIQQNAGNFFEEITALLARIPRPLLLLLKTNDLLRAVAELLHTGQEATFLEQVRVCRQAVYEDDLSRLSWWRGLAYRVQYFIDWVKFQVLMLVL